MKLLTWNCNGAFRKKYTLLDELQIDIAVIQECENPQTSTKFYKDWSNNYLWKGDNKNKGLGVFAKENIELKVLDWSDKNDKYKNEELELFIPCLINNTYILLAVWTKYANSEVFGYIGQFWKYLQLHKEKLKDYPCIIIGDFNSNAIWDKWDRWWNHTDVVKELKLLNISSLYHKISNEKEGEESVPTFYLQRKLNKHYHIDYVFVSDILINKDTSLEILESNNWLEYSDHIPIKVEIDLN